MQDIIIKIEYESVKQRKKHNERKKILYGIIIAFIFLLSIGFTYAFFNVTLNVVGDRNAIEATVGTLRVLYTDGPEIVGNNIEPGWTAEKIIKVKNTGTYKAYYSIVWGSLTNEIINDELILEGTCVSDTGTCEDIPSQVVDAETSIAIGVEIEIGEEHTYVITFEFIESGLAQNYNQGKLFGGVLNVIGSNETFTLMGTLYDPNGDPMGGATIEVHSIVRKGITDENGDFEITKVEVGTHEVNIKDESNNQIATDTIVLLSGEEEGTNGKEITAISDNGLINLTIKLNETNTINEIKVYPTLTVNLNGGTSAQTFSTYYKPGAVITLAQPEKLLYRFLGWGVSGTGSNIEDNLLTLGEGNTILTANWGMYSILTVNLNGGTTSQTFNTYYEPDTIISLINPIKNENMFTEWTVIGASIEGNELTIGTEDVTLTANYLAYTAMYTYTGNSTLIDDGNGNWRIKFLTNGTFTPQTNMAIDIFAVGGGGGGSTDYSSSGYGGGGGSGYTKTYSLVNLTKNQTYSVVIGASGAGYQGNTGGNGGASYFNSSSTYYANGGNGAPGRTGGAGGSGGGGGGSSGGIGGSDGSNGTSGVGAGGAGQGTTTREFGEVTGDLYAGGGGGYGKSGGTGGGGNGGNTTTAGAVNTGSGGGGGNSRTGNGGSSGGTGIVIIRNSR